MRLFPHHAVVRLISLIAIAVLLLPWFSLTYPPARAALQSGGGTESPNKNLPDLDLERALNPAPAQAADSICAQLAGWSPYDGDLNALVPPPSVAITSPSNGASFPELTPITINATASAQSGIVRVSFLANGQLIGSDKIAPYSTTWNYFTAGQYSLTAVAVAGNGGTATSVPVSITVTGAGGSPPAVSITSPSNGAQFNAPANISITANATASPGRTISRVDFYYSGSISIATAFSSPYTVGWSGISAGTYSLTARAIDNTGAATTSATISISVLSALPTVSITSPPPGSVYNAPVNISISANATASQGRTISLVEFFYGGSNLIGSSTTQPYSVVWNSAPVGSHLLTAKATDNFGAQSTSQAVNITVNSGLPPTANITSPQTGASYQSPANITINASATASSGRTITNVDFYAGGNWIGNDPTSPYSYTWPNVQVGTYSLTARATDNTGATGTSPAVAVHVTAPPPPPAGDNFSTARLDPINRTGYSGEDLFSRNFNWSLPIVSLPGRAGLDVGLALSLNSLVWTKDGSLIKFNADNGFPGPGFRLGFPVIQQRYLNSQIGVYAYLMITPSGSRVEFRQVGSTNTYESADSSYSQLVDNGSGSLLVRTAGGSQLSYTLINSEHRCGQIKDRNGNYLVATYDAPGTISTITDTLGRVVNFELDAFGNLTAIWQLWNGIRHNWATFGYSNLQYQTNFPGLTVIGPQNGQVFPVLTQVSLADGTRFNFTYNTWGQVYVITNFAANGQELNYVRYGLPIDAGTPQSDCPRFTQRGDYIKDWNNEAEALTQFSIASDNSWGQLTAPDGTMYKEFFATTGVQKGLTTQTEVWSGGVRKKWTATTWTQDSGVSYRQNPRISETNVYDEAGNRRRATVAYNTFTLPSGKPCSVPSDTYEYASDAVTVLRRSHIDYNLSASYIASDRRIIGLPTFQFLYDGNPGTLMSKAESVYDDGSLLQAPTSTPFQHDGANYGTGFVVGRGNLSRARRYDVVIGGYVESQIAVNTAGSPMFTRDPLNHQTTLSYTDSFAATSTSIPGATLAYPTTITDPDGFSSTSQYDYDHGAVRRLQNPKGAVTTPTYDSAGRLARTDVSNGAYTRHLYPNASSTAQVVTSYTLIQTGGVEFYSTQVVDGIGRTIGSASDFPGSTGRYRGQYTVYDIMGRVSAQSNPTEITNLWVPAGDDATGGWRYTFQTYDWQGRPRITTNTDDTTREMTYGGCGCAGGDVVTARDEMNRRQRITYDVLGRLVKTESLNFDQTVYTTRTDSYNARDQVTSILVRQGTSGTSQETVMTYDGHGRLASRKIPIEAATAPPTTYLYNADDTVQKVYDARGASQTYSYNARHLVTGILYAKPGNGPIEEINAIPDVPSVGFEYDAAGNRAWMTDGLGRVDYVYDTWSRLTSETRQFTDFAGSTYPLNYDYNLAGGLKSLTDPFGAVINYFYNDAGQMTSVTGSPFAGVTQYASSIQYRAWGALKHMVFGVANVDLSYNGRLQITSFKPALNSGHTNYQYHADGRVSIVQYVDNPTFDRKYSYDHASRLSEGLSGTDARGEPYNPNNPNPYKQTYSYDVFDNMSQRTNRWWTQEQGAFTATYTNDRNAAWGYDDAGNIKNNLHGTYKYDTAGRMKEFDRINEVHITQLYDGDGLPGYRLELRPDLTDRATIYYVRSSVLGGQPVTEVKANGSKRRTYVYVNGEEIARQEKKSPDHVAVVTRDPVTGDDEIDRDPLGGYIGSESDVVFSDYYELKGNLPTHDTDADPFDTGSGCTLDGVPFDCNSAIGLVNQGAAFYAPLKSIEAIYNRVQRTYTGFAVFDPHLGEFTRLTQIRPQKNPPVLVSRNGRVFPSAPDGEDADEDADAGVLALSQDFKEGPLWNNAKQAIRDRLAYIISQLLASGDCVYWFEGATHKVGHPAKLPDLFKSTGLNFYLSGDSVSIASLPTKPTPLNTGAFGIRGDAIAQTLGRGTSDVQIVFNRSAFDNFDNPRLAEELIHEMFHAAGLRGSAPKGSGFLGWRRANDLNPEVQWDDIRQHCGRYIK